MKGMPKEIIITLKYTYSLRNEVNLWSTDFEIVADWMGYQEQCPRQF